MPPRLFELCVRPPIASPRPKTGPAGHPAAELFKYMAGVDIVRVACKGNGPAVIGLVTGEVQIMLPAAAAVVPHVKSGKLRALAVASARPSALLPGLPPIAATGLPGYEATSPSGIFAPRRNTSGYHQPAEP